MQERFSNANTCLSICKNRVIQREKVLSSAGKVQYNATNVIFYNKNRPRKIVSAKNDLSNENFKNHDFLAFLVF